MAKFKSSFDPGDPVVMRGHVKFAEDVDGRITITLAGYDIPITTNVRNVEPGTKGPAPKSNDNARISG